MGGALATGCQRSKIEPQAGDDALGSGDAPATGRNQWEDPCRTNSPHPGPTNPPHPPSRSLRQPIRQDRRPDRQDRRPGSQPRKGTTHRLPALTLPGRSRGTTHPSSHRPHSPGNTHPSSHRPRSPGNTDPSSHRPRSPGNTRASRASPGQSTCNRVNIRSRLRLRSRLSRDLHSPVNTRPRANPDRAIPNPGANNPPSQGSTRANPRSQGSTRANPANRANTPGASPAHNSPHPAARRNHRHPVTTRPQAKPDRAIPNPGANNPPSQGSTPANPASQGSTRANPAHNSPHPAPQRNHRHPATTRLPAHPAHMANRTRTAKRPRRGTRHRKALRATSPAAMGNLRRPRSASQGRAAPNTLDSRPTVKVSRLSQVRPNSARLLMGSRSTRRANRHPSDRPGHTVSPWPRAGTR